MKPGWAGTIVVAALSAMLGATVGTHFAVSQLMSPAAYEAAYRQCIVEIARRASGASGTTALALAPDAKVDGVVRGRDLAPVPTATGKPAPTPTGSE